MTKKHKPHGKPTHVAPVRSFTDAEGRTWRIRITTHEVRQVRDTLGRWLPDAANPASEFCQEISSDPVLLVDVLYVVCRSQAEERRVSDEDFGRALAGDAIWEASCALLEAVCDFFPSQAQRDARRALVDRSKRVVKLLENQLTAAAENQELDRRIDALFAAPASSGTPSV